MTSKLRNPTYKTETTVKVTLLNFGITSDGLQQQLLGVVVSEERPHLTEAKNNLVVQNALMKKQMPEFEVTILRMLSEASGDILDDETLINTPDVSKKSSEESKENLALAEVIEKDIDTTRSQYASLAFRSSLLYFCVEDVSVMDPMYQYSLGWFMGLFRNGIQNSIMSEVLTECITNIIDYFTFSIYQNVCRSLFENTRFSFRFCCAFTTLSNKCKLSPTGTYIIPRYELHQEILDFLKSLPMNPVPEVFGLHDNATITSVQNEIADLFENALSVYTHRSFGEGKS